MNPAETSKDYYRIEKAINYLKVNYKEKPSLKKAASHVSLSEYHFQRLFQRWVGISPKKFLQYISKEEIIGNLLESDNILEAAANSGLSSQSRIYDLVVNIEAVTPGELKTRGKGLTIEYGIHETPFGKCQIAITTRGICSLIFLTEDETDFTTHLEKSWENAEILKNEKKTLPIINKIFSKDFNAGNTPLNIHLKGTNFQIKVWEALLRIPCGNVTSYENIAKAVNKPRAVRAAASAIANNPISFLIPCHRVIRKSGVIHNYRWGPERKVAMLGWEQVRKRKK